MCFVGFGDAIYPGDALHPGDAINRVSTWEPKFRENLGGYYTICDIGYNFGTAGRHDKSRRIVLNPDHASNHI
jgi:hypothetical protein